MLFPGRNYKDLGRYRNLCGGVNSGFLGVARTSSLKEYFAKPAIAEGPRSHFVQTRYNPALVKTWMQQALEDPAAGRTNPKIPGMRLIDCQKAEIVEMQGDMEYFALSYVWHLANEDIVPLSRPHHITHEKSLPVDIPRVVADAMAVTLDLGYHYLWVDQFCIDQNLSPHILVEHLSQMDQVFMSAKLTIIAASTSGALPGVGDVPRIPQSIINIQSSSSSIHDPPESAPGFTVFTIVPQCYESIKKSTWYQRGWCFQESVLSVARLYFTDREIMFESRTSIFAETYPEPHELLDNVLYGYGEKLSLTGISWQERLGKEWNHAMYSLEDPRGRFWAGLNLLTKLLGVYTGKDLSYAIDSINGFRGILKIFTNNIQGFAAIAGVPLFLLGDKNGRCPTVSTTVYEETDADFSSAQEPDDGVKETHTFQQQALTMMLLWRHEYPKKLKGAELQRRSVFPSWSWAGWKGKVSGRHRTSMDCIRKDGEHEPNDEIEEDDDDGYDDNNDSDESSSNSGGSSNEDCELRTSTSSERSSVALYDWTFAAFQCTSGKTVPLEQAAAYFQADASAQRIGDGDA
ncbi:HET domain-containing protein [Microdochium nivale]|nr:HET domain-containing protein [Microdochium nivale]